MLARMQAAQTFAFSNFSVMEGVASTLGARGAGCCAVFGEGEGTACFPNAPANTTSASRLKTIRNFCKVDRKGRSLMGIVSAIIARACHFPGLVLADMGVCAVRTRHVCGVARAR